MARAPLEASRLYRTCRDEDLPFGTTAELPDAEAPLGQARAIEALYEAAETGRVVSLPTG